MSGLDVARLLKAAAALEAEEKGSAKPERKEHEPAVVVRGNAKYASHGEYRKRDGSMTWGVYLWDEEGTDAMEVAPSAALEIAAYLQRRFDVAPECVAEIQAAAAAATAAKQKGTKARKHQAFVTRA